MAIGDVIYAENYGDEPLVWKYANQRYRLPPGQETIIPWEAMALYMGDPNLIDVPGDDRRRYRTDELKRLYFKHGAHDGDQVKWEANKPRVHCRSLDGEPIITVVDDPAGEHLTPEVSTRAQNIMLQERMRRLEAELKSLKRAERVSEGEQVDQTPAKEDQTIEQRIQVFEGEVPKPPRNDLPRTVTEDSPSAIPSEIGS